MNILTEIFIISVIICLHCYTFAFEKDVCDIIQISIFDSEDQQSSMFNYNFTKQPSTNTINGRPFYYSLNQEIIWWNNKENSWMGQVFVEQDLKDFFPIFQINENLDSLDFSKGKNWTLLWNGQKRYITQKCYPISKECVGTDKNSHTINFSKSISKKIEATAKGECVFPFKYEGETYNACTQIGDSEGKFWCATSVTDRVTKDGGYGMGWGYCTELCPTEDSPGTYPLSNNYNPLPTYKSGTCDLVQFSFDDLEDPNNYQNFTKQSANLNGRPLYYSMNQSILWWSNKEESWLYSTYVEETANFRPRLKIKENLNSLSFPNKTNWKNISVDGNIKSKCAIFNSKCLARRDGKYTFQFDNTTHLLSSFEVAAIAPCIFPFKFKGKVYTSCTEDHYDLYWCATTTNATMDYQVMKFIF